MPKHSLRTTLTAWNVAAFVGMLCAFGGAIVLTTQGLLSSAIDRDLTERASRAAGFGGPPGPPPPIRGERRPPGPPIPAPGPYFEANRAADIQRPRFFRLSGEGPFGGADEPFDRPALDLALSGVQNTKDISGPLGHLRVFSRPLVRNGSVVGAVQVARDLGESDLLLRSQLSTLLFVMPVGIFGAAAIAKLLTNRALKPIAQVTAAASEISRSDLTRRLTLHGDDELAEMAGTFNDMVARLQSSFEELEATYSDLERAYETQRRFTADASHELRTPLTRLRLTTSAALTGKSDPAELRRALESADLEVARMTRLVHQLLTLSLAGAGGLQLILAPVDLRVLAADALARHPSAGDERISATFCEPRLLVRADAEQLERAFTNILENALRHAPSEGFVRVAVGQQGSEAVLSVEDSGSGIAPEHQEAIFEPFFRADAARGSAEGGAGLGLAIAKSIVEAHGGRIEVASQVGGPTKFRLCLPIESAAQRGPITSS